jgi:hypothetical protein
MAKPAGDGRNVNAGLYAPRSEQVAQIMVRQFGNANHLARSRKRFFTLTHFAYRRGGFRVAPFQSLKQLPHVGDNWHKPSRFPIPRAPHLGVVNRQKTFVHVGISKGCGPCFG